MYVRKCVWLYVCISLQSLSVEDNEEVDVAEALPLYYVRYVFQGDNYKRVNSLITNVIRMDIECIYLTHNKEIDTKAHVWLFC